MPTGTTSAPTIPPPTASPTASNWAAPVDRLAVGAVPTAALNLNVAGRRLAGPVQGFGQLWQKTYRVRLAGADVTPEAIIRDLEGALRRVLAQGQPLLRPVDEPATG